MVRAKTMTPRESDLIKVSEARKILGISANKMAALIGSGALPHQLDPLDHRVKLVRRRDVENLIVRKKKRAA
jgi:hypothetical protein